LLGPPGPPPGVWTGPVVRWTEWSARASITTSTEPGLNFSDLGQLLRGELGFRASIAFTRSCAWRPRSIALSASRRACAKGWFAWPSGAASVGPAPGVVWRHGGGEIAPGVELLGADADLGFCRVQLHGEMARTNRRPRRPIAGVEPWSEPRRWSIAPVWGTSMRWRRRRGFGHQAIAALQLSLGNLGHRQSRPAHRRIVGLAPGWRQHVNAGEGEDAGANFGKKWFMLHLDICRPAR
jgi:hypothetical protein